MGHHHQAGTSLGTCIMMYLHRHTHVAGPVGVLRCVHVHGCSQGGATTPQRLLQLLQQHTQHTQVSTHHMVPSRSKATILGMPGGVFVAIFTAFAGRAGRCSSLFDAGCCCWWWLLLVLPAARIQGCWGGGVVVCCVMPRVCGVRAAAARECASV